MTTAVELYNAGFTPLVSVIPPNASLSPSSRIQPSQLGKTPGRRLDNGTWAGYKWLHHETKLYNAQQWTSDGANIGILAAHFPGVDIDTLDESLAEQVQAIAHGILGMAPVRVGAPPEAAPRVPYQRALRTHGDHHTPGRCSPSHRGAGQGAAVLGRGDAPQRLTVHLGRIPTRLRV